MRLIHFSLFTLGILRLDGAKKPNIIFILTDDQGYADVGFTNPNTPFVTKNIDKLAERSIRLENYYVHPTCTPTRAALLTGRYAANVGLGVAFVPGNPGGLEPEYVTLPDILGEMGYTNHLVGKWHLGNSKKHYLPLNRGFHNFYGVLGGGLNSWTKQAGAGRYDFWRDYEPHWDNETHITDLLNAEALRVIENHVKDEDSSPFFLYLSHTAPHDPLLPHPRHLKQCSHIENRARRLSCGMVAGIDEGVGDIVRLLEKHKILDNTIIAYSHDNGGVPYAGALNYPLKGAKATAYEGGVRSPGFIHAPTLFTKPKSHAGLFHVSDYLPTFISMVEQMSGESQGNTSLTGVKLDGVNQVPALRDGKSVRESVHIHRDLLQDSHIYRKGNWKIIVGHHEIPFIFPRVYEEPSKTGGWLLDGGSLGGRMLEMLLTLTDMVVGEENYLFIKYMMWFRYNSYLIGGMKNWNPANPDLGVVRSVYRTFYKTDLEKWNKSHSVINPKVSLFNLADDPDETDNLAEEFPDLVKELLAEAEEVVKDAKPSIAGNMVHSEAPRSAQEGSWRQVFLTMGTIFTEVVPFGPYLENDVDITKLKYNEGFLGTVPISFVLFIALKTLLTFLFLLVLPITLARYFFNK